MQVTVNQPGNISVKVNSGTQQSVQSVSTFYGYAQITNQVNAIYDVANNALLTANSALLQVNAAYNQSNLAYTQANTASANTTYLQGGLNTANNSIVNLQNQISSQQAQITLLQAYINTDNAAIAAAYAQANSASANTVYITGVDLYQNNQINFLNSINTLQNTNITAVSNYSVSAYNQANSANILAQAAFNTANTGSSNTNYLQGGLNSANANIAILFGIETTQNTNINAVNTYAYSAYAQANATNNYAFSAYTQANTSSSNTVYLQGGLNSANANIALLFGIELSQNANTIYLQGALNTANANTVYLQGGLNTANANTVYLQGGLNTANANTVYLQGGLNTANANTIYLQGGLNTANANTVYLQGALNTANANTVYLTGVNLTQNANIIGAFSQANSAAANTIYLQGALNTANNNISANVNYLQGALNTANTNTIYITGVDLTQNANIIGAFTQANSAAANTIYLQGALNTANANSAYLQGGLNTANANIAFILPRTNTGYNFVTSGGTVSGNTTIQGNLVVTGNVSFTGNATSYVITGNTGQFFGYSGNGFNALYTGIPVGYLLEPQIVNQFTANYNGYAGGVSIQNINSGANASGDIFISADNGTINDGYLDLGLGSSNYSYPGYNLISRNDGYLFTTGNTTTGGGNMIVGTGLNNDVIFAVGGINTTNEIARLKYNTGLVLSQFPITFADGTKQNTAGSSVANTVYITGVDLTQNANIAAAFTTANNAIANLGPIITTNSSATVFIPNPTSATSQTVGALVVSGGIAAGSLYANTATISNPGSDAYYVSPTLKLTIPSSGIFNSIGFQKAGTVLGGVGYDSQGSMYVDSINGTFYYNGQLTEPQNIAFIVGPHSNPFLTASVGASNTTAPLNIGSVNTASYSNTTGAVVIIGGLGVSGNVYVSGNVVGTSSGAWTIPVGTTTQRPTTTTTGMIRYNSTTSQYEGFGAGSAWSSLGGVQSVDQKAYISAELTAGNGDDVLRFYSGSTGTSTLVAWMSGTNTSILQSTPSVNTTSGALQVTGGVGIQGNTWIGGNTSVAGYATISGNTFIAGNVAIACTTPSISNTTGALVITGGVGISGNLFTGNVTVVSGNVTTNSSELTLSATGDTFGPMYLRTQNRTGQNGLLIDSSQGSVALAEVTFKTSNASERIRYETRNSSSFLPTPDGSVNEFQIGATGNPNLVVGDNSVYVRVKNNNTPSLNTITGALVVAGGVGIQGNLNIGGTTSTYTGNVAIGNTTPVATLDVNGTFNANSSATLQGVTTITNATPATSNTAGALVVTGGIGVSGNIIINGITSSGYPTGLIIGSPSGFDTSGSANTPLYIQAPSANVGNTNIWRAVISNPYTGSGTSAQILLSTGSPFSYVLKSLVEGNPNGPAYNEGLGSGVAYRQWNTANTVLYTWQQSNQNVMRLNGNGQFVLSNTIPSTSTTNGSLVVNGGVGVAGNLNVGGTTSTYTGNVAIGNTTPVATLDVNGTFNVNSSTTLQGVTSITNTTISTSNTTGALVVAGGIASSGNLYSTGASAGIPNGNYNAGSGGGIWAYNPNPAYAGGYLASPSVGFTSSIWNSASGAVASQSYIRLTAYSYNVNPVVSKLSFNVGVASAGNPTLVTPTEQMFLTSNGILSVTNTITSSALVVTNNVAIGNTTPVATLDVNGTLNANSTVTLQGVTTITNTTSSTAYTNGALVVNGGTGIAGNLNVNGANTSLSGNLNVYGANTSLSGNLNVYGANTSLSGNLNVYGANTSLSGNLNVYGANTLFTGNVAIGGALTVSGNVSFKDAIFSNVAVNTGDTIVTSNTTPTVSNNTGALVVAGGAGIGGAVTIGTNQPLSFTDVYDLDDISYKTDGFTNTFPLTYNQNNVIIPSPFNLVVTLNGLIQPAFDYKYDTFWLANILTASKGYCIDTSNNVTSNGYIKFADTPPQGSQILVRTVAGSIPATKKTYPFKPLDVLMGY